MRSKKFWVGSSMILILVVLVGWFLLTENSAVWPIRNSAQYHLLQWWWSWAGEPEPGAPGRLRGVVTNEQGQPIPGAWVLLSRWDGTTYRTRSDADGQYVNSDIPAGTYRPVAGAPGYDSVRVGRGGRVRIRPGQETVADVILPPETTPTVSPGDNFWLNEPADLSCQQPIPSQARQRQVHFTGDGQPNQLTFYYTPLTATVSSDLPLLLAVYPGPADSWECVSLPLAAAGYAVLGAGPAYSFDLEADVDELVRLLNFAREGRFPGSDGEQIALLGGSYSSLHVLRLLQRGEDVAGAVLLGPPTDLFEMRRRLEEGTFVPPFGLDQAFYALGLPSREPLRYWRYSGAYHINPDFPPLAILHSRTDDVVPYQQSEFLIEQLEAAGVPHESYFFDGGGHYLLADDGDEDALRMYDITLDFLAKHLP